LSITIEDADVPAIRRLFTTLFGVSNGDDAAERAATRALIANGFDALNNRIDTMSEALSSKLSQLQADVAAEATVKDSAVALIQGISTQITDLKSQLAAQGVTPDQLALVDALDAAVKQNTASLAAAVPQNTQAAAEPTSTDQGSQPAPADQSAPAASGDTSSTPSDTATA
jgi:hypothetical protein